MSSTLGKACLACLLGIFIILLSVSQVSAQETGTLIVYEEAQGGDATFSFSGSGSMGNFQIATEANGGAKVFDLSAGTYTLTQSNIPSGWSTREVFADGTGTFATDASQSKATFTVSSAADVFYLRFSNAKASTNPTPTVSPIPSPSIPENIGLPLLLVMVAVVTSVLVLLSKKKRQVAPVLAILLSVLMVTAFIGQVQANPDKYIKIGTSGNDEQTQFGTPNKDVIVQLGFGGSDSQYGDGNVNDDWIIQIGGSGDDSQTASAGNGNDHVLQEGGDGNDFVYADGGDGYITFVQNGGLGDDNLTVRGGTGGSQINISGGAGADTIDVTGTSGIDSIIIDSGSDVDSIKYNCGSGADVARIDGGAGNDFLTITKNQESFKLIDGSGVVLYSVGSGGSTITVVNVEHGQVIGDDGKVAFQW